MVDMSVDKLDTSMVVAMAECWVVMRVEETVPSKVEMKAVKMVVWSAALKAFRLVDLWVDETAGLTAVVTVASTALIMAVVTVVSMVASMVYSTVVAMVYKSVE